MTAPRIPLFQRKGAPPAKKPGITIAISHENPGSNDGAGPGSVRGSADDEGATVDIHDVTCPACGAEFDAETGEMKGDVGKGPQPDEQAPGGDALANLFGGAKPGG